VNTPVGRNTSSAVSVDGSPEIVIVSGCFPGSDSVDASFNGEPLSLAIPNSGRTSGVGVLVPREPGDVTVACESSPEWKGLATRVGN
jgi:hypothetical protein